MTLGISDILIMFLYAVVYTAPIWMCNMFTSFCGKLNFCPNAPVDGGKTLKDGRRLFGENKTWRGLIGGSIIGILIGVLIWYLNTLYSFFDFSYPFFIGVPMVIGDHIADLLGSYIKRRLDIKPGGTIPLYDQGSWMVVGILLALPFTSPIPWAYVLIIIILTPLLHILLGFVSMWLKIKKVWY